ncbi:MAG: serine/threonine-protein kinase [Acidobacteria bacterium]|nr:serine/threonine-protein kinase [Acidobacteriota bacterium]
MDERLRDLASEETVAMPTEAAPQLAPTPTSSPRSVTSFSRLTKVSAVDEGRFIPGTLLGGRYRIIGLLGKGGMGEVYRATDLTLGQAVALKFLPEALAANERFIERFQSEVRVARQVSHPNVCRVYDIGEVEGLPFISMEYVDGEDLSGLLQRIGRLPADKALETARKLCAGLAAAHDKGVIHRDLKPQNIMLNKRGEPVIMDFGLAAIADTMSGPEARNGTPAYMSPEQLRGVEVTAKSDIYALGLVLYEVFTGKKPYDAQTIPQLLDLQDALQLHSMSSVAADIDPAIEKVIRRCLDPHPAKRPATALSIAAALPGGDPLAAALAAGETPSPEMVAAAGSNEGLSRKWALSCLLVIVSCLLAAPWINQQQSAFLHSPLEYTPDVLKQKARDMAVQLGYPDKPKATIVSLSERPRLLQHLNSLPSPKKWDEWLAAEGPILLVYREALSDLLAEPNGRVTPTNPALVEPGMVRMELDAYGYLRLFEAQPYAPGHELAAPISLESVFQAAGLEMAAFQEVSTTVTPRTAADQVRAWKGPHPKIPGTPLELEVGWWRGRVTLVRVVMPWMKEDGSAPSKETPIERLRVIVGVSITLVGVVFAALLARRNWRLGRADRQGALRMGLAMGTLVMLNWACRVDAVLSFSMLMFFREALSDALMGGAVIWLLYLALEPALRARWPHSIVTWNRLLTGRFGDPQVCADLLIGATVGIAVWAVINLTSLRQVAETGLEPWGNLALLSGPRRWLGLFPFHLANGLQFGLVLFWMIFGLKQLLRRDWLAISVGALLFSALQNGLSMQPNWLLTFGFYVLIFGALMAVLIRVGMVATMASIFYLNFGGNLILGTDWRTWYAPASLAAMGVLLGFALYVFNRSLGERELLGSGATELHS